MRNSRAHIGRVGAVNPSAHVVQPSAALWLAGRNTFPGKGEEPPHGPGIRSTAAIDHAPRHEDLEPRDSPRR